MSYLLTRITKSYGAQTVLELDSLEFAKGRIYALIGPNGAGKTTLLKILGFLEAPSSGTLIYDGRPVSFAESACRPLRRQVVLVHQHPIMFSTTVYRNLEFGLKLRRVPRPHRRKIIEQSLELVGLAHAAKALAHKLSGGETQRVALARALALCPRIILLDEPTANLDRESQEIIVPLLREIQQQHQLTIIFSTHDRHQAALLADHTLFLDRGRVSQTSYENLYAGELESLGQGRARCCIQGAIGLELATENSGKIRLTIDPRQITLASWAACQTPSEADPQTGTLAGRVVELAAERRQVRVLVEGVIKLTLFMSESQYQAQPPLIGQPVLLRIPASAIRILGGR